MNAITERWVGVRRELLDRILIMNARHLRKVLAEYEFGSGAVRSGHSVLSGTIQRIHPRPVEPDEAYPGGDLQSHRPVRVEVALTPTAIHRSLRGRHR